MLLTITPARTMKVTLSVWQLCSTCLLYSQLTQCVRTIQIQDQKAKVPIIHYCCACCPGKAGSTSLGLSFLDPTGLVAWQCHTQSTAAAASGPGTGSLLLLASPSKRCWRGIQTHINNAVHGVMQVCGCGSIVEVLQVLQHRRLIGLLSSVLTHE